MSKIKPGDTIAFRRLFNFLIKCQTMDYGTSKNSLDSPDVVCMIHHRRFQVICKTGGTEMLRELGALKQESLGY